MGNPTWRERLAVWFWKHTAALAPHHLVYFVILRAWGYAVEEGKRMNFLFPGHLDESAGKTDEIKAATVLALWHARSHKPIK